MNHQKISEIVFGTIGSGPIVRWTLDAVARIAGIRCAACYSRSEEKGRELAAAYHVEKVYTDLAGMLQDPELNFIYIASPNDLHFAQAKMALEYGKNVICEKPLTPEKSQAEALLKLAAAKGLLLFDAVPTLYLPNYRLLQAQLPRIGRIRLVMSNFSQYSSRYDNLKAGQLTNVFSLEHAGGCLQDINFYNIYLNTALFGAPADACYYPNLWPGQADTSGIMLLRYADFVSSCAGAKDTWGDNHVLIEGDQGYIRIKDGSNGLAEIRVVTRTTDETFSNQTDPDRYYYEFKEIARLILADERDIFARNMAVTVTTIGIMEQARKAAGIYFAGEQ